MNIDFDEAYKIIDLMKKDLENYQSFMEDMALKRLAENKELRESWKIWFKIK